MGAGRFWCRNLPDFFHFQGPRGNHSEARKAAVAVGELSQVETINSVLKEKLLPPVSLARRDFFSALARFLLSLGTMKSRRVLFVQHGESDRPGVLGDVLLGRGIPMDIIRPDLGQPVPQDLQQYSGLALGGGAQGVYETDRYPYLAEEIRLVRRAAALEKPVIGLCLGAQLMAAALGADVRPAGFFEIGFHPVELEPIAELDPLWTGLPRHIMPTHWHGDVFELPPGGMPMGRSRMTPHQAFRYGAHLYGFQFHLEMTLEIFEEMVRESEGELASRGCKPDELVQNAHNFLPPLRPVAETVFSRWADFL